MSESEEDDNQDISIQDENEQSESTESEIELKHEQEYAEADEDEDFDIGEKSSVKNKASVHKQDKQAKAKAKHKSLQALKHAPKAKGDDDDDSVSIDFSRIGGLFKKKPEHSSVQKQHQAASKKNISEKESLSKKVADSEPEDESFELKLDTKKVQHFFSTKKVVTISIILLILIPFFIAFYLRAYPAYLPVADDMAKNAIYSSIKSSIRSQVLQEYPKLSGEGLDNEVNSRFSSIAEQYKAEIAQQVKTQGEFFRSSFQDDSGQTYMLSIDPFFFYHFSLNVLRYGHPGDTMKDGKSFYTFMNAPNGRFIDGNFQIYAQVVMYRIMHFFDNNVTLLYAVFWIPVLFSALSVVPAFFIVRRMAGNLGGFIAALIVAVHPVFMGRTTAGAPDTDPYAVFFPLLIAWIFFEIFHAKKLSGKLILSVVAGFLIGVFDYAWTGWWYIFYFIVATLAMILAYRLVQLAVPKKKLVYLAVAGLAAMFFIAWTKGFIHIFGHIVTAAIVLYLFYEFIRLLMKKGFRSLLKDESLTHPALVLLVFVFVSFVFVSLFFSPKDFLLSMNGPFSIVSIQSPTASSATSIWPNVYTTVAELNTASLSAVISQIGGRLFIIMAAFGVLLALVPDRERLNGKYLWILLGSLVWYILFTSPSVQGIELLKFLSLFIIPIYVLIFYSLYQKDENKDGRKNEKIDGKKEEKAGRFDLNYAFLITIWFLGTIYAGTKGVRFIMLLVPAFAIAFGIFIGRIASILSRLLAKHMNISMVVSKIVFVVIALVIVGGIPDFDTTRTSCPFWPENSLVCKGHFTSYSETPIIDDAWVGVLTKIQNETSTDAIVNSWWDFGHWFKAVAERRVTFDGASQNSPVAHWMGKALLASDEHETVAILRMFDCGSNDAFNLVNEKLNDSLASVKLVKQIIMLEAGEAKQKLLEHGFTGEQAEKVLSKTHCDPPQNIFITSGDMVSKSGVWGHFGAWDFEKAHQYNIVRSLSFEEATAELISEFGMTQEQATQRYYELTALASEREANNWIAAWPGYFTGMRACFMSNVTKNISGENGTGSTLSDKELLNCPFNAGLGMSGDYNVVLERAFYDFESPEDTILVVGFYDPAS
ncbi:MAG: STT3 domain-containing protein, partial [Candidatus Woesearchaeota archaeon]